MNEALQTLEVKVENNGTTPQGKIFAREWNVLVEAVKALDLKEFDEAKLLQFLRDNDFITSEDIPDVDFSNVVTLSGQQTIPGAKDFVGGIKVNGMPITYNAELGVWEFLGDLFVTGNFAWGSSIDGFKPSTVMDAVRVDDSTIIKKKDSNGDWYLYAPGGGSGGSGGGLTLGDVVSYLSDNDYTTKTDVNSLIASSLAGYATEQWVANKGYLTSSALNGLASQSWVGDNYLSKSGGTIEGDSGALDIKRNSSSSSFIKYSNTNGVLGYLGFLGTNTPYFWDNSLTPVGLIHERNVKDFVQEYALPITGGVIEAEAGNYTPLTIKNQSMTETWIQFHDSVGVSFIGSSQGVPCVYLGSGGNNAILHSGNIGSYNAGSADVLKKSFANEDINYGKSDGLKLIYCHSNPGNFASAWQSGISVITDYTGWQLTSYGGDVENPYFRSLQDNGVWKPWRQLAFLDSDVLSPLSGLLTVNGNAAIGGILTMSDNTNPAICFGSYWYLQRINNTIALGLGYTNSLKVYDVGDVEVAGNIEGGIFGLRNSSPDNPLLRLTVGNQNYYVQATSDGIYLGPTSTLSLKVDANGNTTINGNLLVYGYVSWFSHSQRSLKNIISEQGLSLAQLERIKPIKFYWKDGRDMALHVGGVADVFAEVLPEVVARNIQDILCLNYVDAAFYVGASLIAPVLDHERRITKGEAEQEALKKENAKLKRELEEVKSKLNHLAA